jgi:CHAT domain-containing protein/tetratricopeptide (TPR) repeat protein
LEENPSEHIGSPELAKLLEEYRGRVDPSLGAADVHPHLESCLSCREQFEELTVLERRVKSMRADEFVEPESACPVAGVWREIAGGVTAADETLVCIEHASRCDHCGPLLHEAVSELREVNGELTEAERRQIASLESACAEWQLRLAKRIAGTPRDREVLPWWERWGSVARLATAGASFLALVSAGSWIFLHEREIRRNQPAAASELLARAYSEQRSLELRIAGAEYAPLRVSRGQTGSFTSRPAPLLKAEVLIASQLESHAADPAWLQAQADADVLEGKYEAAVEALRRALESEPHSPTLLTDLATAYFQRGQQEGRSEDFGAAFEYLSQALKARPDDPIALFNRAIVSEHEFLYQQALDDWEHYLRIDTGSQWAEEARNRADALREKLKKHRGDATPLLSPDQFIALNSGAGPPSAGDQGLVDQRVEEYLHEALLSWLPEAFPEDRTNEHRTSAQPNEESASRALFFLAELTNRQHGDRWLADLLLGAEAPHFPQAVTELGRAVKANDDGGYSISREQAHLAERSFRASGNRAGVLRAQFEQAYADQMERHSEECRRHAANALSDLEHDSYRSYPWLQIQLGLEKGVCSFLMGDIGADEMATARAMDLAQRSDFAGLYLRAILFAAEDELFTGDQTGALAMTRTGLERYWSRPFSSVRGYSLYAGQAYIAEAAGRPNLQLATWREGVALIDRDNNLLRRAMAHDSMADAAIAAGLPEIAQEQYAEAARLSALGSQSEASRNYAVEVDIRIAQLEERLGHSDAAATRLTTIQRQVGALSNNYLVQMFYSTLGELELARHREPEAEKALRTALALAETSLGTLRNETERARWRKYSAPAYLALSEAQLVQDRSQEALETYELYLGAPQRMASAPPQQRLLNSTQIPNPMQLPSRLPLLTKETVLAYAALPDGLAIWVYDDRGINGRWMHKPIEDLQESAKRFQDLASDPKSDLSALRRGARTLFEELIAPVQAFLAPGRTLVIEADGWLGRLPFEALLDTDNHYLIEDSPIVHSPGLYSQMRLRNGKGISPDLAALVVGSATSSPVDGLVPLPDVASEADSVASGFDTARVLKGASATLSAVEAELPRAQVFHFAGHSLSTPGKTGLMLEDGDGKGKAPLLLDAADVRHLHLRSLQLAVLSACSTAAAGGGSSEFDSVTDAFLSAGVPHVVASRWAVDSSETRAFVEDFYHNALSGETVSEATRLTSRKMLALPRTSHPYYWAAFAAYGRP